MISLHPILIQLHSVAFQKMHSEKIEKYKKRKQKAEILNNRIILTIAFYFSEYEMEITRNKKFCDAIYL